MVVAVFGGRNHPWTWTWTPTNTYPHTIPSPTLPRDTSLVSDQHKTLSISSLSSFFSAPSFSGSSLLQPLRHIITKGYPLFNLTIHPLPPPLTNFYPSLADFYFRTMVNACVKIAALSFLHFSGGSQQRRTLPELLTESSVY